MNQRLNMILATPGLKEQLRELALLDFDALLEILAVDDVQVFICAESAKDKSVQQITNRLKAYGVKMGRSTVGERCQKCPEKPDK